MPSALAWRVSRRLGRKLDTDSVIDLARAGKLDLSAELRETARYLAVSLAAVINLFNPATVFVHTRLFDLDPTLFDAVVGRARQRTLPPSFADCRVIPAKGSKRQGAVAGAIQQLTDAVAPDLV